MPDDALYPPIGDYALIADSNSVALVSREGSIDWCCIQRIDSGNCFGRLLDWERGGFCSISPKGGIETSSRRYIDNTLVLETTFHTVGGEVRLLDCFALPASAEDYPYRQLLRIVEGVRGQVELDLKIAPRFDYGDVKPWVRHEGVRRYSAIGGNDGLLISSDADIRPANDHDLEAAVSVRSGERVQLSITSVSPEKLDEEDVREVPGTKEMDRRLKETIDWWEGWCSHAEVEGPYSSGIVRSAITIRGLVNDTSGAIAASATTSLPEIPGGSSNWDYRYSWVRDSFFSVRSLAEIGFEEEAERYRRFVERSSAGSAQELQLVYGVGGERRLTELTLGYLEGYKGASPVRIGNAVADQLQLDVFGELLELAWRWRQRGNSPDDDYWRFLVRLVNRTCKLWEEPDHGLWESRGEPQHYVHSKVMCWTACDRGVRLAEQCMRRAPVDEWEKTREEIRHAIESEGYDEERGTFTRTFGTKELDAALLLLPRAGFVDYNDERMVRTTDAIREELDDRGLIKRYRSEEEGA
ncbi:MAG: glycoside hydrolase family 15 protein, partial [Actinomycetota bacterium]|nr:glycoside hydrolase family 15 protein [Actinomycetota bacterium]